MSNIQQALGNLFYALEHLESAAKHQAHRIQVQQDIYNSRPANDIDPAFVASRLDTAIDKIEQILKEG